MPCFIQDERPDCSDAVVYTSLKDIKKDILIDKVKLRTSVNPVSAITPSSVNPVSAITPSLV